MEVVGILWGQMGQYVDLLLTCVINPKSECINIINMHKEFSLSPCAVWDCWLHEFKSVHVSFVPHKIRRIVLSTHNFSTLSGKQWIREISWTRIEIHAQLWWRLKRKSNGYYTAVASNCLREHWSKQLKFFFKPRVASLVKINEHMPFSRKVQLLFSR